MDGSPQFCAACPSRLLFDQVTDKWSMMVLAVLDAGPVRFNAIKRRMEGVTQKALVQCLRRLERNGMISRRVIPVSPVAVEYEITMVGRTLKDALWALHEWTLTEIDRVEQARLIYDRNSRTVA